MPRDGFRHLGLFRHVFLFGFAPDRPHDFGLKPRLGFIFRLDAQLHQPVEFIRRQAHLFRRREDRRGVALGLLRLLDFFIGRKHPVEDGADFRRDFDV